MTEVEKLKRELAEANAKKETLMQAAAETLTAERERAKGLVDALEEVIALHGDNTNEQTCCKMSDTAFDALSAYRKDQP